MKTTTFRLSDEDPATGRPYARTPFRQLPTWVMDVVLYMGVSPAAWNELVAHGRVLEVPYLDGWHRDPRNRGEGRGPRRSGWPGAVQQKKGQASHARAVA